MIVSDAWLARAPETLATAIRIADAAGLSPTHASFATSSASAPVKPAGPFLAFDAPVEGAPAKIKVEGDRLVIGGRNSADLLDVAGLDGLGALSVAHAGNSPGLLYSTIGSRTAAFDAPFVLTGGDVAVLGPTGVLAQIDTRDPFGNRPAGDDRKTWLQEMWGRVAWSGPAAMAGLFLLVVLRARNVRRRRSGDPH